MLQKDIPKRLVLVNKKSKTRRPNRLNTKPLGHISRASDFTPKLRSCGKSKSLDSSDIFHHNNDICLNTMAVKKNLKNTPEKEIDIKFENQNSIMAVIQENTINITTTNKTTRRDIFSSPLMRRRKQDDEKHRGKNNNKKSGAIQKIDHDTDRNGVSIHSQALANLEKLISKLKEDDSKSSRSETTRLPRSQPSSPAPSKKGM